MYFVLPELIEMILEKMEINEENISYELKIMEYISLRKHFGNFKEIKIKHFIHSCYSISGFPVQNFKLFNALEKTSNFKEITFHHFKFNGNDKYEMNVTFNPF